MRSRAERLAEYVRLQQLLPQAREQLMRLAGVRDVAVGVKEVGNRATEVVGFRVYVDEKRPPGAVAPDAQIPRQVLGVPTDVVLEPTPLLIETGDDANYRPLQGGIKIGNDKSSKSGTLGCIAQRTSDGSIVLLSNHHVMMAGNAAIGESIGQPEISCCCCCKGNIVGEVVNAQDSPLVDAAIAKVVGSPGFTNDVEEIGAIFGSAPLNAAGSTVLPNDKVRKRGATTRLTTGTVLTPLKAAGGKIQQIEIKPDPRFPKFAYKGDSGSVVVNEENIVVGLLWSIDEATETLGYANLIPHVLATMGITLLTTGTPGTVTLGAVNVAEDAALDLPAQPLTDVVAELERSATGCDVLAFFRRHNREINELLNTNREVKVAWNRFHGPSFTAHLVKSAREPAHRLPRDIEGVAPANLLIRMSVVLQAEGSAELAAAVDEFMVPLLTLIDGATSVRELLDRARAANAVDTTV